MTDHNDGLSLIELGEADDLLSSVSVMRVLRPHLDPDDMAVVAQLKRQMAQGYRLLTLARADKVVALAGFRFQENTVFGEFVYVDDVVVANDERRRGYAERLLEAVREIARASGRHLIALDTALTNSGAQRVYHRCGYETVAYHLIQRV